MYASPTIGILSASNHWTFPEKVSGNLVLSNGSLFLNQTYVFQYRGSGPEMLKNKIIHF